MKFLSSIFFKVQLNQGSTVPSFHAKHFKKLFYSPPIFSFPGHDQDWTFKATSSCPWIHHCQRLYHEEELGNDH